MLWFSPKQSLRQGLEQREFLSELVPGGGEVMRQAGREEKPKSGFLMEVKAVDKWGFRLDGPRSVWGVFRIIF